MIDLKLLHKNEAVFVRSYNETNHSLLRAADDFIRSAKKNIHIRKILMENEPTIMVYYDGELTQSIIIHKLR